MVSNFFFNSKLWQSKVFVRYNSIFLINLQVIGKELISIYIIRGAYDMFPDYFRMGI